ncbi:hypothetical protein LTS10_002644 [Elasticomyces elasticus]|nr:hypothetical protein LTS10_002644 [Elasticomyces elasticus]
MPPEIRNHIFELVLITQNSLSIGHNGERYPQGTKFRPKVLLQQPPLTRVDRQTRSEALPVFYSQNTFLVRESGFGASSDTQDCYRSFANVTALKYLKKLSYWVEKTRYIVSAEPGWIDIALSEAKELEFAVRGPPSETCVCGAITKLRGLVAGFDPAPAVSVEEASRLPGRKLVELASRVVPDLVAGLKYDGDFTDLGPLLSCSKCGKVDLTTSLVWQRERVAFLEGGSWRFSLEGRLCI